MKLSKKLIGKIGVAALIVPLSGCAIGVPLVAGVTSTVEAVFFTTPGSETNDSYSTWSKDWSDIYEGTWRGMGRDIKQARTTFNRVFLSYDENDPYLSRP